MNTKPFIQRKPDVPLLHKDLTEKVISACYEVSNELGAGFLESVYQNALLIALRQKGFKVFSQVRYTVEFRGEIVGEFVADMVVEDKVIVELKAVSTLASEHSAQVINYLKASGLDTGLLINFGQPRIEIKHLYHPRSVNKQIS